MSRATALAGRILPRSASGLYSRASTPFTGIADQALSSTTNLAVTVLIARSANTAAFGAWGLVNALYLLELCLMRGAVGSPYTVSYGKRTAANDRDAVGAATAMALVLTPVHLAAAGLMSGPAARLLAVYALMTPGLLVQDPLRRMLYAQGRARRALESNVAWLLVQGALSVPLIAAGSGEQALMLAWAAGGWASAVYCLWALRVPPVLAGARTWFGDHRNLAISWAGDEVAQEGLVQILIWTTGAVAGLSAVGAYRGAIQLTGPATVVFGGIGLVLLPAAVRRSQTSARRVGRFVAQVAPWIGAGSSLMLLPLLLLPDSLGEAVLGVTWEPARRVLPFVVVTRVLNTLIIAPAVGLRALRDEHRTLVLRLAGGLVALTAGTAAAARWEARGVAVAVLIVAVVQTPVWFLALKRHLGKLANPEAG